MNMIMNCHKHGAEEVYSGFRCARLVAAILGVWLLMVLVALTILGRVPSLRTFDMTPKPLRPHMIATTHVHSVNDDARGLTLLKPG